MSGREGGKGWDFGSIIILTSITMWCGLVQCFYDNIHGLTIKFQGVQSEFIFYTLISLKKLFWTTIENLLQGSRFFVNGYVKLERPRFDRPCESTWSSTSSSAAKPKG